MWPVLAEEDVSAEDVLLELTTFGHRWGSWMQGREAATEMYARFRDELRDFVATGTLAWGQYRP